MHSVFRLSPLLIGLIFTAYAAETPPFLNPNLATTERVADFISRLTLEQKAQLLNHRGPTVTVAGFALRADQWNQCLNGVKWTEPTTLFPTCIALGATWNTALVNDVATVLSDEARAIYNGWHVNPNAKGEHKGLIYRAPVIELARNPFWGRTHEVYSEDTFLTSRMAVAYVSGLQGNDPHYLKIAATLKHYAVNNVETDRHTLDARVPERWLNEYWLSGFHDAVVEGHAQSLMASYNAINGVPNTINRWLLTDLLKGTWQHEGFVVSDLGGVQRMVEGHEKGQMTYEDAVAQSVMAGCDFSDKEFEQNIPGAVRSGKLSLARLDDAVRRVITTRMRLGEFDPQDRLPWHQLSTKIIASPAHRAVARKAAEQAIVLLKNLNQTLPLQRNQVKNIAVIGPLCDSIITNNYNGDEKGSVSALEGIRRLLGSATRCESTAGAQIPTYPLTKNAETRAIPIRFEKAFSDAEELAKAVKMAKDADTVILTVGTDRRVEIENRDRTTLGLPGKQQELVEAVLAANPHTIVVLMSAGPLSVPWINEHAPAVLQAWWGGNEGGTALADVLFGNVNPAGRLPYTVYASDTQAPPDSVYDISQGFTYQFVKGAPLYPFGYGLSYTTFAYSAPTLSATTAKDGDTINVSATITNTGSRAGDEVVQVYVSEPAGKVVKPKQRLAGFARISLAAGANRTVQIPVQIARLRYWDEATHHFIAEPGTYTVHIGSSSDNLPLNATFTVAP